MISFNMVWMNKRVFCYINHTLTYVCNFFFKCQLDFLPASMGFRHVSPHKITIKFKQEITYIKLKNCPTGMYMLRNKTTTVL